jgi:hypothetical protein
MKKIFTLVCGLVIATQFSFVAAQTKTLKVWKDGSVTATHDAADVDSVTFEYEEQEAEDGVVMIKGHKFIDLGLPSKLLWAEANIGAETAADDGIYFSWAETDPNTKESYGWANYKYGSPTTALERYNSTDGRTQLETEDDAACANWGTECRMPTIKEFEELRNEENCTWEWTSMTNSKDKTINGYKVTSVKNGKSIFFPATGDFTGEDLYGYNEYGCYWSSSFYTINIKYAWYLYFDKKEQNSSFYYRFDGYPIRPVAQQ